MNKSEVCVRLTEKNCKKVLGILEMFGEPIYKGTRDWIISGDLMFTHLIFHEKGLWCGQDRSRINSIKPKELKQILAREHLKPGDVIIGRNYEWDFVGIFEGINCGEYNVSNWRPLQEDLCFSNDVNEKGSFINFLRFAADEEKALLDPKTQISQVNPVETKCGIIDGFTRYTREVWVNHYHDGEYHIHTQFTESQHKRDFKKRGQTVKATLTYDIPMTKV